MSDESSEQTLSNLSHEERRFEPPEDLARDANVRAEEYDHAAKDRLAFWAGAAERLSWGTKWDTVLDWDDPPFAKWFVGGTLNAAYNCVDRHVENGLGDRVAIDWVGEPADDRRTLTYSDLKDEVSKAANGLLELGVGKGDPVAIYLPMIPETVIAMLACARIGAIHTVVFGGFSADALVTRITDLDARVRHHRRRRLPPWRTVRAQAGRRRGDGALPRRADGARRQAHRTGRGVARRP